MLCPLQSQTCTENRPRKRWFPRHIVRLSSNIFHALCRRMRPYFSCFFIHLPKIFCRTTRKNAQLFQTLAFSDRTCYHGKNIVRGWNRLQQYGCNQIQIAGSSADYQQADAYRLQQRPALRFEFAFPTPGSDRKAGALPCGKSLEQFPM